MDPIKVLQYKLTTLEKEKIVAKSDYEYARRTYRAASEKLDNLEVAVATITRAIEVLENQ
jgi:hypothetical protein